MRFRWALVALVAMGSTACTEDAKGKVLKLGAVMSNTGDLANVGGDQRRAAALAVEEINQAGGVLNGMPLEIVYEDDASDPSRGREAARRLVDEGVPVIFGAVTSGSTLAVAEVTSPAGVVVISGSATSPNLTTFEDDNYLYRTAPSDALQGVVLAQRARAKGFTKVAILHEPGAYGRGLAAVFAASFNQGSETVTQTREYEEGQASYQSLLTSIFADAPQAVLLAGYPTVGVQIIDDYLTHFSGQGAFWFFTDGLQEPNGFMGTLGASRFTFPHEGTGLASPTSERFDAFLSAYEDKYGVDAVPGAQSENVYDAVYLAALAIESAGAVGVDLRSHLHAVASEGESFNASQFQEAKAAIAAGEDINFEGASGPVDFDAFGDIEGAYSIWKIQGGSLVVVETGVTP